MVDELRHAETEFVVVDQVAAKLADAEAEGMLIVEGNAGELPQLARRYTQATEITHRGAKMRVEG